MRPITALIVWLACATAEGAVGPTITVRVPEGVDVKSAVASSWETKVSTAGKVGAGVVVFENVLPDTPYEVGLTLADGTVLQGVNLDWYGMDPAKPNVTPLSEDDTKAITELFAEVKTFENKKRILQLRGDSDRVTALVEVIRDSEFHASGGNIIWRVELWYYKNQFGGWQKVQQQSKVLRRERFKDAKAMEAVVPKVRWVPELGGIKVAKGRAGVEVAAPKGKA